MSRRTASMDRTYFDRLYAADPDPWKFASSEYERRKYAASLAALPPTRFAAALEIGCSIGIFTKALAPRCDTLLALDVAQHALDQAKRNCPSPQVQFENRRVPEDWPHGHFDLIVLSEVLYYLLEPEVQQVAALAQAALNPNGTILLVHYLGLTDYPLTGDAAAEAFIAASGLTPTQHQREAEYRLDVLATQTP